MYLDKEVKKVFTTKPMISFRSARHCNDKRLVYLSTCNCCKKQYVGQVTFIDKTNPSEPLKKGLLEKYPENYVSLWSLY